MTDLAPFSTPGRFWRGNLHTHSTLSDGVLTPEQVVDAYQRAGYDFLVLSEHFLGRFGWPVADTRRFRTATFTTIIGAELHAPQTSAGEFWHILATGLPLDFAPCADGESGSELAARARAAGAFVTIAHPAWSRLTMEDGHAIASAHAVEIYNHGCAVDGNVGEGWYLLDQMLNENRQLTAIATDDAHFFYGHRDAFGGWLEVKCDALEPDSLLKALLAGHFYATQGPKIHELSLNGQELNIACSPVENITVLSGTSRSVKRHGRALTRAVMNLDGLKKGWFLKKPSDWFRICITDAAGQHAWTNPIWRKQTNGPVTALPT